MTSTEKLGAIRQQMQADGVDAYIIPSADPHMSEYLPAYFKTIPFVTGFTGSVSTVVITQNFAGLWADSRYFEQAEAELKGSGFELVKLKVAHTPEYISFLSDGLPTGGKVAYDERTLSVLLAELLEKNLTKKQVTFENKDYVNALWPDRPALPLEQAYLIDATFTGQSTAEKLTAVREKMAKLSADYHLVSSLDDLAWLFNLRGADVNYNPVTLAFALISATEATLFIATEKLNHADQQTLASFGVNIVPYQAVAETLAQLPASKSILIDPKRSCIAFHKVLPKDLSVILETNPSTVLKGAKNQTELSLTRQAMLKDGVAMVQFFKWIAENIGKIDISELSAEDKLASLRAAQDGFVDLSFGTIAGYRAHGALPHYKSTPASNVSIEPSGLFLVDSGGQYKYGTTDITRVIPMGNNTDEEATDYTLVLKGLIAGSRFRFPKGTCGYQIDSIVRQPLWEQGINFGHGTGHGVGFFLNVHEGPHVISPAAITFPVNEGSISSIEPGIYRPGKHGVRIENLVAAKSSLKTEFGEFLDFETLTLCPIHTSIIKKDLLSEAEVEWFNNYHQLVYEQLSPLMNADEQAFLKEMTKAI